jgi:hypothetical protein
VRKRRRVESNSSGDPDGVVAAHAEETRALVRKDGPEPEVTSLRWEHAGSPATSMI